MSRITPARIVEPQFFGDARVRASLGTLVLAKGVYDLTHGGHVESLWHASAAGDTLVVAISDDESVQSRKGAGRPVLSLEERSLIVGSLKVVDFVVHYSGESAVSVIFQIVPDVVCASHFQYLSTDEVDHLRSLGVELRIIPKPANRESTSQLVARITEANR